MKLILKRQSHLEEQISKDFALLKEIEDEHRLTSDPQEKARLKRRTDELNEQIVFLPIFKRRRLQNRAELHRQIFGLVDQFR